MGRSRIIGLKLQTFIPAQLCVLESAPTYGQFSDKDYGGSDAAQMTEKRNRSSLTSYSLQTCGYHQSVPSFRASSQITQSANVPQKNFSTASADRPTIPGPDPAHICRSPINHTHLSNSLHFLRRSDYSL